MRKPDLTAAQKITQIYTAVICSFYFLFVGPGGFTAIARNKALSFTGLTVVYLIALAIVMLQGRPENSWKFSREQYLPVGFLIAYLLFSGISALLSPFAAQTIIGASRYEGIAMIAAYVFICLAVMRFAVPKKWMVYLVAVSTMIFDAIAFLQLRGQNPFSLFPAGLNYYDSGYAYQGEYLGTIGNVDLVAAVLCAIMPLLFFYILVAKADTWRFFLVIPLLFTMLICVQMKVMAAYVGLGIGLLFSIPICLLPEGNKRRNGILMALGTMVLFAVILFFVDTGSGMFHEVHQILHGHIEGSYGSGRVAIWKEVWELICQRPILGSGPDTLYLWERGFKSYDPSTGITITTTIDTAHNELLNIWVNQGIFPMLSYLGLVMLALKKWLCHKQEDITNAICGSLTLCYFIQAMFGMSTCINAPYFWIPIGYLMGNDFLKDLI